MAILVLAAPAARAADKGPAPGAAAPGAAAPAAPGAAAPAGGMPDMSKVGPLSRPVTKQDKKGIDDLYKAFEAAMMKGDVAAAADLCDFPIIMMSDTSTGGVKAFNASREKWTGIFSPMVTNRPKDLKMSGKHTPTFLSDTLAVTIEQNSMSAGKVKGKWNAMAVLVNVDGKWKFKQMAEAGWGDMPETPATAAGASAGPSVAKAPGAAAGPAPVAKAPLATPAAKK
jgi:hypothetical protein